ncbi:hypothetical protein AVEN_196771-1 [Araneus ventricosus]|uniref:RNase H type-1 domain-containing protein n=1 Tax=Araneus ventricosus TaxID=182803 RepID=A0A4Y2QXD8_ARAVE|nr:hypothetical protein AVEN_196771-1 [Araneus ventricosus]
MNFRHPAPQCVAFRSLVAAVINLFNYELSGVLLLVLRHLGESASTDAEDVLNEGNKISHSAALQSVDTLLDYTGQRGFDYGDITAAHVGHSGNEAADVLAKKATQEGIPTFIKAPRNHIKSLLQKESIIRWQKEWDNGETGRSVHNVLPKVKTTPTPWQRPEIMFVTGHGPFPTYLNIRSSDSCGCGNLGNPLHYATSCLFTTSYHLTKPSADLEPLWWKRVMNNNNSRAKIKKLMHFIAENEPLLFPKDGDDN